MHKTVQRGIDLGLVRYEDTAKGRCVLYIHAQKFFPISKPEEWVRLLAYLQLVLVHNYPPDHIALEYPIKMGSSYRYADIVVFSDADLQIPYILVECKREEISTKQFEEGVKQALSYARQIVPSYIWVTSGDDAINRYGMFQNGTMRHLAKLPSFSIQRIWWREIKRILSTIVARSLL